MVYVKLKKEDGIKSLFKNSRLEERLASSLGAFSAARIRIDVGDHAAIENGFAVQPTIIDAIETDDGALKVHARHSGDARHFGQSLSQQRRFIAIARRRYERRDHVAPPVAEGDDLVAFHLLVPAEADVVTALFCCRRRAIAVNDGDIEEVVLPQLQH